MEVIKGQTEAKASLRERARVEKGNPERPGLYRSSWEREQSRRRATHGWRAALLHKAEETLV